MSLPLIRRRSFIAAGLGLGLNGFGGSVPAASQARVGLVFVTGNSHSIGWDKADPSDRFDSKIRQYDQAGKIGPVSGAALDSGDHNGQICAPTLSPLLTFLNRLAVDRQDLETIVVVPTGKGSTGFVDGVWSADTERHPNRLTQAMVRWRSAYMMLRARGLDVEPLCAIHMSARPDARALPAQSVTARASEYAAQVDAYVDILRMRLQGVDERFPVIVSAAMTQTQIESQGIDSYAFSSAGNGLAWRKPYTWFVDPVHDWGDGEGDNLPVKPFDGAHANRQGLLTEGRLLYAALARAKTNAQPFAPFSELDSYGYLVSLYDFRTGCAIDRVGHIHLEQPGQQPGLIRYSKDYGTFVFKATPDEGRSFMRPGPLPQRYTVAFQLSVYRLGQHHALVMNEDGDKAGHLAMLIDPAGVLVVGHAGREAIRVPLNIVPGEIVSLAIQYDGKMLSAFRDGKVLAAAPAAPLENERGLYLGCRSAAGDNPFTGEMRYCAVFGAVLTQAQIAALAGATFK